VKPSGAGKSEGGAVGCVQTARTSRDGVAHPRRTRQSVEMDKSVRMWPNDPKLSDGGAWRGACPTVERTKDAQMWLPLRSQKARAVTRGAVRCSAWLGDMGLRVGYAPSVGNALLKCCLWIECLAGNLASVDVAPGDDVAACGNLALTEEPSRNESLDGIVSAKLSFADGLNGLLHRAVVS